MVGILLASGADVNLQGGWYGRSLQAAAARGHEKVARCLIAHGAEVNAQVEDGYGNALQAASAMGHEGIVKLLLKAGANVNATGGTYGSALQAAKHGDQKNFIQILVSKEAKDAASAEKSTSLQSRGSGGGYLGHGFFMSYLQSKLCNPLNLFTLSIDATQASAVALVGPIHCTSVTGKTHTAIHVWWW